MGNLCIIPARGGSKRIPRKNIKDFLGKPIIAYSIEAAIKSRLFEEVMVSTDDEEIASIAIKYGAKVPFFRSIEKADDFATTADVITEVLGKYSNEDKFFENACCLYATAPLLTHDKLKEGYEKLITKKHTSVFPVVEFQYPIFRGLHIAENGKVSMIWPEHLNSRSQDIEKAYHDAGQWYWLNIKNFEEDSKLFSENSSVIVLDALEVQDIDTELDWKLAEIKYEFLQSLK